MADEALFEYLHSELVAYAFKDCEKDKQASDLSTLEYIGFSSGYRIIERLTKEWPRFKDELDTMKFICTDFWSSINKKQIDNLRTNHQGVYVLQDNAFRFLTRLSTGRQYLELAPRYVAFTCGLIRGALSNLGINSMVTAEVQSMPACKFHIQVQRT
ncbi:trafficking protein particle complex subunit 6b [Schistocerca americana]|uniref:trafficking protein particle complex subunit 6b n=1 Tax=Schistocerca americana TaxID=7009 RepID=UPI001F4F5D86|nr:trafficking protein particle complex subunit 6b [Schistocerca americana]XP_047115087.1 trafficking protein particle complex subunit 6b [Schistocerca piceifrons]XP_049785813.1 trafficking protein particle complex subunit 6b [Schistocerca cancellata]XP_049812414.1 trafficking protein particle complex subunit 6b [Schistocerca nitens]XP_049828768.1 trafficking protein particle complex subunit 6b [Schistocerca gregaria]XP_049960124.1 trafficking protein particle complex subunit 6b [Schistocerca 